MLSVQCGWIVIYLNSLKVKLIRENLNYENTQYGSIKKYIIKTTVCETIGKHQHYVNLVCISFVYRMFIVKLGFLETD